MEKKIPSRTEKLRPVKLSLDDLEQIVSILKTESNDVKIETKEYKFESLEELVRNGKETIYELKLESRQSLWSPVKLSLNTYTVELYISEDEPKLRGIFEKIKEILVKRERIYRRFVSNFGVGIFLSVYLIFMVFKDFLIPSMSISLYYFIFWFSFILANIINIWVFLEKDKYSIIVLKHQTDQVSFWKRNSDKILLLLIGTIIPIALAILVETIRNIIK